MPNEERKITIKGKKATVKGTSVYKNGNYVGQLGSKGLEEDKAKLTGGKTSDSFPKNPKAASKMRGTKEEMAEKKVEKRNERVKKRGDKVLAKASKKSDKIIAKKEAGKITKDLAVEKTIKIYDKASKKSNKAKYIMGSKKDAKAASKMLDHAAKMSDTDMGIKERYGKQATSDVLAAQQKGNPIMPNLYKDEYTDSGMNYRDANNASIKGTTVDEGHLSNVKTKSPYRPHVETEQTSKVPMRPNSAALPGGGEPGEKLFLDKAAKMHAQHPSKKRMADMVTKVATYNMPNVKAAQKKYYK